MARVVLGVTGSIAAYKACSLASSLSRRGHAVTAVLTASARQIVAPLAFQTLTGRPPVTGLFDPRPAGPLPHISLAEGADLLLVAPATANACAKFALGLADDALSTLALSVGCARVLAPAMNHRMWAHPAVQDNVETLQSRGWTLAGPAEGWQACGDEGPGRMMEPEDILALVAPLLEGP